MASVAPASMSSEKFTFQADNDVDWFDLDQTDCECDGAKISNSSGHVHDLSKITADYSCSHPPSCSQQGKMIAVDISKELDMLKKAGADSEPEQSIHNSSKVFCSNLKTNDEMPCENKMETVNISHITKEKCMTEKTVDSGGSTPKEDTEKRMNKKKFRKTKVKKPKKWRPVDSAEYGFHFTRLPHVWDRQSYLDPTNLEIEDASNDMCQTNIDPLPDICDVSMKESNETYVNEENVTQVTVELVSDTVVDSEGMNDYTSTSTDDKVDEQIDNIYDDGEAFFASLGIDVNDCTLYEDFDEVIDWDGIVFEKDFFPITKVDSLNRHNKLSNTPLSFKTKCSSTQQMATIPNSAPAEKKFSKLRPSNKIMKTVDQYRLFELECTSSKKIYIRRDRDRRVQKAHKAVKSKNCVSILNNPGRKNLYMHHRLFKMHNLDMNFRSSARTGKIPPMPKKCVDFQFFKDSRVKTHNSHDRVAPVQNLKHALHESNIPSHLDGELSSFFLGIQHRELTPEDYELLLLLDDSVKPKTVSQNVLDSMEKEIVGPQGLDTLCTICMEPYISGQERKILPCEHDFHSSCIDTWLNNSSMNCPLDGLPVDGS